MKSLVALLAVAASLASAAEPVAPAPITRVSLFKDGLAAVERVVTPPAPGPFLVTDEINPLHGTLWFAPADGLSVARVDREVPTPNYAPFSDLRRTFLNQRVTLQLQSFNQNPPPTYTGTVVEPVKARPPKRFGDAPRVNIMPVQGNYLTLRLDSGELVSFPANQVVTIQSAAIRESVNIEKPVLLFTPRAKIAGPLTVSYLTRGLAWAPAYRIALGPDGKMRLDQSAVISNELEELKDVELNLVSGFPNIRCAQVLSPMATKFDLMQFFQQLNVPGAADGSMIYQKRNNYRAAAVMADSADMAMPGSGTTEDIQITPVGRITLATGDALYLPLVATDGAYERIVDWTISDNRDEYGRRENGNGSPDSGAALWDAIRFRNPLARAITTGPVEIIDGGNVLGQAEIGWVNPGESAVVKIAKALTISGKNTEYEIPSADSKSRQMVYLAGRNYFNPEVAGEVILKSYRQNPARVFIKLQFSGKLISAEGNPKHNWLERGVYSVNPRSELEWELTLKPGEELKLQYRYSVLVLN